MNELTNMLPLLMTVIGLLAITVSVIIQVIKNVSFLAKVPTDLVVIILSVLISVAAFFAYSAIAGLTVTWYYVIGTIIGGFFVAFIAMYGWEKLTELIERFKK